MTHIQRTLHERLAAYVGYFPVTAILGPRQCGKTTLAALFMEGIPNALYLDLERPSDLAKLADPETFLHAHRDELVCLDEIQRAPELFPVLRSLCDETGEGGQFLILGSASPDLLRQSSETLAGRIGYLELTPFTEAEVGGEMQRELWTRGGFPRSLLAPTEALSWAWRESFVKTFLERDMPQFGIRVSPQVLRDFWTMCAHMHGELWNHSKIASSLGVTGKTVSHYLSILEKAYMLRRLPPAEANVKKRLVKSPRVYLRDTGLLHYLLRIEGFDDLSAHPVKGASWEGYVIEQIAAAVPDAELSFYRTSAGAEVDLLIRRGRRLAAVEMKASRSPRLERGFRKAVEDLAPDEVWVAAPVDEPYPVGSGAQVAPVRTICRALAE